MHQDLVGSVLLLCATALFIAAKVVDPSRVASDAREDLQKWALACGLAGSLFLGYPRVESKVSPDLLRWGLGFGIAAVHLVVLSGLRQRLRRIARAFDGAVTKNSVEPEDRGARPGA